MYVGFYEQIKIREFFANKVLKKSLNFVNFYKKFTKSPKKFTEILKKA